MTSPVLRPQIDHGSRPMKSLTCREVSNAKRTKFRLAATCFRELLLTLIFPNKICWMPAAGKCDTNWMESQCQDPIKFPFDPVRHGHFDFRKRILIFLTFTAGYSTMLTGSSTLRPLWGVIINSRWRNNLCRRLAAEVISMQEVGAGSNEYAGWYWRRK